MGQQVAQLHDIYDDDDDDYDDDESINLANENRNYSPTLSNFV
jgi:hypothetical protein